LSTHLECAGGYNARQVFASGLNDEERVRIRWAHGGDQKAVIREASFEKRVLR
jgi:hypothetical protein